MPRKQCCRRVSGMPVDRYFKPQGIPMSELDEIVLTIDEFESLRLADLQGLYQDKAAEEMNVSRQTFGRIIESARKKVAQVLVEGKALRIEGGEYEVTETRKFKCAHCNHTWEIPYGTGRPSQCPECNGIAIHRAEEDRGWSGRCAKRGHGRGACQGKHAEN